MPIYLGDDLYKQMKPIHVHIDNLDLIMLMMPIFSAMQTCISEKNLVPMKRAEFFVHFQL